MTILVTGGTGLVGPRLLARLTTAGISCRALVRPGKALPDGVERIEGDILDPDTLEAAVEGVTDVIHLAAVFRTRDDEQIWRVNLEGTRNLLAAVTAAAPAARFLFASTSNVYDADAQGPSLETDPVHPTLAYPASKIAAESLVQESSLAHAILRLPFIYGDGDGHLEALPELAASMNWHPAERLSVSHHADIANAFELALTGAMDGRIVNIAADATISVLEAARIVGQPYALSAEPLAHPWKGQTDVTLARSLGFEPTVPTVQQAARLGLL